MSVRSLLITVFVVSLLSHALPSHKDANAIAVLLDHAQLKSKPQLRFVNEDMFMKDAEMKVGETLELSCTAFSIPPANIYWVINNRIVQGVAKRNILEKSKNVGRVVIGTQITRSRFVIPCLEKPLEGYVACIADNGHSRIQRTVALSVVDDESSRCLKKKKELMAPRITQYTHFRLEDLGNTVTLSCNRNVARAHTEWSDVDGNIVHDKDGYQLMPNGDLVVEKLEESFPLLMLTCTVWNGFGRDTAEVSVYISEPDKKKNVPYYSIHNDLVEDSIREA